MTGYFITFEGGEGSGKTTQINRLAQTLSSQGYKVITTREPGGTPEAEKIRELLVQREGGNWSPMAEVLLLFAARQLHIENIIQPALQEGNIILCDRFTDSTRAYQGYGHGLPLSEIEGINDIALKGFTPNFTIILDVPPHIGLSRSRRRLAGEHFMGNNTEDRYEQLENDFHERLRKGFLDIAKNNTDRCCVFDALKNLDELATQIAAAVKERLS